jgi:hypothetical protein
VLVRTGGRFPGARGGDPNRSWLLIKHRDEWSGDLDIAEFAPRSVKSDGDFEDILSEGNPAIWLSNRPAKGGDTGALFAKIIERALALKGERTTTAAPAEKQARSGKAVASPKRVVAADRKRTKAAASKVGPKVSRKRKR